MKKTSGIMIFLATLTCPGMLLAATAAHGHKPMISDLFWYYINFTVFTVLLFLGLRKPFQNFWTKRRETIEADVTRGERQLQQAQEELSLAHVKHQQLNSRIEELIRNIRDEGHREAAELREEAKRQAERIKVQAERTAISERESVKRAVQSQLVNEVLERVERQLSTDITAENDRARRNAALKDLGALLN